MKHFSLILILALINVYCMGQYTEATINYELGSKYFDQKDFHKAIEYYSASLQLYPAADAYINRALSYIRINDTCNYCVDLESAIRYFDDKDAEKYFYRICAKRDTLVEDQEVDKKEYPGYKYTVIDRRNDGKIVSKKYFNKRNEQIFGKYDKAPEFPGGDAALAQFFKKNIIYPQIALTHRIEGTVDARFIVRSDGKLSDIKIARGIGGGCDEEYIRVLTLMPDWNPGSRNNVPVDAIMLLPFTYDKDKYTVAKDDITPDKKVSSMALDTNDANYNVVYAVVEDPPMFPGGDEARIRYCIENFKYPEDARKRNIQGTVYVTFVVEKDGTITDIRILKGIEASCDREVIRVLKNMPRWHPGRMSGKPVRVQFNMPFKIIPIG